MAMLAVVAGGFSVSSALAVRGEASAGRAEILAGPVSRLRCAGASVAVAAARTCTTLAAAGFGVGFAYAVITTDPAELPRMLGSALVPVPPLPVPVAVSTARTDEDR